MAERARRPKISTRDQVTVAIAQGNAWPPGGTPDGVKCPLCKATLFSYEPRILEHLVPRALGGSDDIENLRWVHKACADKKTYGGKATSANGDLSKIEKTKRLAVARQAKKAVEIKLTKEKWRLKKKMDGSVVRVRTR